MEQLVQLLGLAALYGGLLINQTLVHQVHGNLNHSGTCALTVTCLEEPELTLLNGELHILHIVVVLLKFVLQSIQLLVDGGHSLFHRRILGLALLLGYACQGSPTL